MLRQHFLFVFGTLSLPRLRVSEGVEVVFYFCSEVVAYSPEFFDLSYHQTRTTGITAQL